MRKSGFSDPVTMALIYAATLALVNWMHGSRCNNIKVAGDNNVVYATLSPQGGDSLSVPMVSKGETNKVEIIKGNR